MDTRKNLIPLIAFPPMPLRIANAVAIVGVWIINALANIIVIGGNTTGSVSDHNMTKVTPAGWAFSIWGVIYFFSALFVIYGFTSRARKTYAPIDSGISGFFVLSCIFNISWILAWHYEKLALSFFLILGLLLSLTFCYVNLHRNYTPAVTFVERIALQTFFAMYTGWLTAATIVNLYIWVGQDASDTAAIIGLVVTGILALIATIAFKDPVYPLVICWATAAIATNQAHDHKSVSDAAATLSISAGISGLCALGWQVAKLVKGRSGTWMDRVGGGYALDVPAERAPIMGSRQKPFGY